MCYIASLLFAGITPVVIGETTLKETTMLNAMKTAIQYTIMILMVMFVCANFLAWYVYH